MPGGCRADASSDGETKEKWLGRGAMGGVGGRRPVVEHALLWRARAHSGVAPRNRDRPKSMEGVKAERQASKTPGTGAHASTHGELNHHPTERKEKIP